MHAKWLVSLIRVCECVWVRVGVGVVWTGRQDIRHIFHHGRWYFAQSSLHHCKMLDIVARLEQRIAGIQLEQYTPDRPNVAWISPTNAQ
jgi:hypothetical protein